MKIDNLLMLAAIGVLGWLAYRLLDQRAEAATRLIETPQTAPWTPPVVPTIPRLPLPPIIVWPSEPTVIVDYDVELPDLTTTDGFPEGAMNIQ